MSLRMRTWVAASLAVAIVVAISGHGIAAPAPSTPELQQEFDALSEQEKKSLLAQAANVEQRCKRRMLFAVYQECACIGARFLDARLQDRTATVNDLVDAVSKQCPNVPSILAHERQSCINRMLVIHKDAVREDFEAFCECVAKDVADRYVAKPSNSNRALIQMGMSAHEACRSRGLIDQVERQQIDRLKSLKRK